VTVTGRGRGGRNQEFALASLPWLAALERPAVLASVGTDGIDGPTDAAGAVADSDSAARAAAHGLSPEAALRDNDAYPFFAALGDLLITGPTGTNVGDVQVVVVGGRRRDP
jgi:hydroxypyruvate reductase